MEEGAEFSEGSSKGENRDSLNSGCICILSRMKRTLSSCAKSNCGTKSQQQADSQTATKTRDTDFPFYTHIPSFFIFIILLYKITKKILFYFCSKSEKVFVLVYSQRAIKLIKSVTVCFKKNEIKEHKKEQTKKTSLMNAQFFSNEIGYNFNQRKPKSEKPANIYFVARVRNKQIKLSTRVRVYPD